MTKPHAPYVKAVVDAIDVEFCSIDDFISDAETGSDGTTCTLTAVITWDDETAPDVYPHGLILCWDLEQGWQHAAVRSDGSNESPDHLPLPLWAAPEDVVESVRALLAGEEPCEAVHPEWRDDAVMAAVEAWRAS